MVSVNDKVTELVGSYWYKNKDATPIEFTIYGINHDVYSNEYDSYEVFNAGGILLGINLSGHFSFDHFPSYVEVYDLIKTELETTG